jgi:hypothetical protein
MQGNETVLLYEILPDVETEDAEKGIVYHVRRIENRGRHRFAYGFDQADNRDKDFYLTMADATTSLRFASCSHYVRDGAN